MPKYDLCCRPVGARNHLLLRADDNAELEQHRRMLAISAWRMR